MLPKFFQKFTSIRITDKWQVPVIQPCQLFSMAVLVSSNIMIFSSVVKNLLDLTSTWNNLEHWEHWQSWTDLPSLTDGMVRWMQCVENMHILRPLIVIVIPENQIFTNNFPKAESHHKRVSSYLSKRCQYFLQSPDVIQIAILWRFFDWSDNCQSGSSHRKSILFYFGGQSRAKSRTLLLLLQ